MKVGSVTRNRPTSLNSVFTLAAVNERRFCYEKSTDFAGQYIQFSTVYLAWLTRVVNEKSTNFSEQCIIHFCSSSERDPQDLSRETDSFVSTLTSVIDCDPVACVVIT